MAQYYRLKLDQLLKTRQQDILQVNFTTQIPAENVFYSDNFRRKCNHFVTKAQIVCSIPIVSRQLLQRSGKAKERLQRETKAKRQGKGLIPKGKNKETPQRRHPGEATN